MTLDAVKPHQHADRATYEARVKKLEGVGSLILRVAKRQVPRVSDQEFIPQMLALQVQTVENMAVALQAQNCEKVVPDHHHLIF